MGDCHYQLTVLVELSENFVFILQLRHFEFTFQRLFNFDSNSKLQITQIERFFLHSVFKEIIEDTNLLLVPISRPSLTSPKFPTPRRPPTTLNRPPITFSAAIANNCNDVFVYERTASH